MVSIQTNLHGITQTEVSRKEFLGIIGLAILSIFGMGTIIKLLTGKSLDAHHVVDGYGASARRGMPGKRGRL